ncbi:hypothetical protein CLV57_0009 [Mucilaginibacter auburnensis]|uniref:Uncharacterized protein n=1 Tax=Mucilaginibacter auburnensis TaxID=1457233 RepID=A0A2H9VQD9_9SPHI|nr:hypothetical protein CLV57_0009 [Mucilaginibacter auburnensis]
MVSFKEINFQNIKPSLFSKSLLFSFAEWRSDMETVNTTIQQSKIMQAYVFFVVLLSINVKAAKTSTTIIRVVKVVLKATLFFMIISFTL